MPVDNGAGIIIAPSATQRQALKKLEGLQATAAEIDVAAKGFKNVGIDFLHANMNNPSTWGTAQGALIQGNRVTLRKYGTETNSQSKTTVSGGATVSGNKYILVANLENITVLNPAITTLAFFNYSQLITTITISDFILSGKKLVVAPFVATVSNSLLQLIGGNSTAINALPVLTPLVSFDSKFMGFIPWTQEAEDYWKIMEGDTGGSAFNNIYVPRALVADMALNVKLPSHSFRTVSPIGNRVKDTYATDVASYKFIEATESGNYSTNGSVFNCGGTRDTTISTTKLWFGFDIKPANYAAATKDYVAVIDGTVTCTNVAQLKFGQFGGYNQIIGQDFIDGVVTPIKAVVQLIYPAGDSSNKRYSFLTQAAKVPGVLSYQCAFTTFSIFEMTDGFTVDDYINAAKNGTIVPKFNAAGTATETYVDTQINGVLSNASRLTAKDFNPKYDVEMLLSGGQSLNLGSGAAASVNDFKTTVAFAGGSRLYGIAFTTTAEKNAFYGSNFIPIASGTDSYPPITASTTALLRLLEKENMVDVNRFNAVFMPFAWGASGASITAQEKGSAAYANMIEVVTKAKEFANKIGKTFGVRAMNWYHGEADSAQTQLWYYTHLKQMFIDINTDIKAITGQLEDIEFFSYQTGGWSTKLMGVQEAQLQVSSEMDNVHIAGAMYQFSYSDIYHPVDRAVVGLQTGVAIKRVLYDNEQWVDFKPVSHTIMTDGVKFYIHLKFDVPVKPMRFDVSGDDWHNPRGKQTNYGFEVLSGGVEKQTAEPFIVRGDTVVLTTNENPAGMVVKYAVTGHDGGGNLCDSQNITIRNKNMDYIVDNFAVAFSNYQL